MTTRPPGTDHLTSEQLAQFQAAEAIFADAAIELPAVEVAARLADGTITLIDVRETYEFEAGHIDGARHIEIERLGWNAPTIDRATPIVFTCRLGIRAKLATHAFRRLGYEAYNLTGGVSAWVAEGHALIPAGGTVADH